MGELVKLQNGAIVDKWQVTKLLGEGGFGVVYEVCDPHAPMVKYALKCEADDAFPQVLKIEVQLFERIKEIKRQHHFVDIFDKGRFANFVYYVMSLVGKSLQDLRKSHPMQHFGTATAISAGIQILEALEDLHFIGYLHRDIKPGNVTIGVPPNELRRIYLLDFGMARCFTKPDGTIRRPREKAGFRGTIRYAPYSCHIDREQSRKDDVESWLYTLIECTNGRLPWRDLADKDQVGAYKMRCRQDKLDEMMTKCAPEYRTILQHIDSLKYYDQPDYNACYGLLRKAMANRGLQEFPYDWEKPNWTATTLQVSY